MKRAVSLIFLFLCGICISAQSFQYKNEGPKKFQYKYKNGDSYRILSSVMEDVYYNGYKHHTSEILNRVSVNITSVNDGEESAVHNGKFMTSEKSVLTGYNINKTFSYGEEYTSIFTRDKYGVYTISDEYFMPVVRDVPVFPDKEIEVGEEWFYQGHEAHDLRRTFDLKTPYKVPFNAHYKYLGVTTQNEKKLDVFQIYYELSFTVKSKSLNTADENPETTTGFSSQLIFWDNEKGAIDNYRESFKIEIITNMGNVLTFSGTAHAEVTDFIRTATQENIDEVTKKIEDLGLENVNVTATDKGLTLSIENIQFEPDSDILRNSEKAKLDKLSDILKNYPKNDLLVTGHCALRGTLESRQQLSEQRASAVADYLIKIGVKDKYHIFTKGRGAEVPVATNATEEGRSKNRRVEITILEE
ncbi:MAG: OmpA family protein [Treponema sp.]|nr:OmpA family protein [Candidatus Treponema merdequi]